MDANALMFDGNDDDLRALLLKEREKRLKAEQQLHLLTEKLRAGGKNGDILLKEFKDQKDGEIEAHDAVDSPHDSPELVGKIQRRSHRRSKSHQDLPILEKEDIPERIAASFEHTESSKSMDNLHNANPENTSDNDIKWKDMNDIEDSGRLSPTELASDLELTQLSREDRLKIKVLQKQFSELKDVYDDLQRRHKQLEDNFLQQRIHSLATEQKLESADMFIEKIKQRLKEKISKVKALIQEKNQSSKLNTKYTLVCQEKIKLEVEIELWKKKLNTLTTECDKLHEGIKEKDEQLFNLSKENRNKDDTISKMAQKLINLKNRIDTVETQLCKYFVKKISKFFYLNADATLVVTKAPATSELSLDVFTNGKRINHPFDTIKSILKHTDSDTRFTVLYTNDRSDVFESQVRSEVLSSLQKWYKIHKRTQQERKDKQEKKKPQMGTPMKRTN